MVSLIRLCGFLPAEDLCLQVLPREECLHAVGQGALAVECRLDDLATISLLRPLVHLETTVCCVAERAFLKYLVRYVMMLRNWTINNYSAASSWSV